MTRTKASFFPTPSASTFEQDIKQIASGAFRCRKSVFLNREILLFQKTGVPRKYAERLIRSVEQTQESKVYDIYLRADEVGDGHGKFTVFVYGRRVQALAKK